MEHPIVATLFLGIGLVVGLLFIFMVVYSGVKEDCRPLDISTGDEDDMLDPYLDSD